MKRCTSTKMKQDAKRYNISKNLIMLNKKNLKKKSLQNTDSVILEV